MKLFTILPITLCMIFASTPAKPLESRQLAVDSKEVTTYLVLTTNGLYNGEKGEDNDTLFLENVIEYTANCGDLLPGKDVVTSSVSGIEFSSWVRYEGDGLPTIHLTVPEEDGVILYADWVSNPNSGGGSGDNGGSGQEGQTMDVYFKAPNNWGTNVNIYVWSTGGGELAKWPGTPMEVVGDRVYKYSYDTSTYGNVIFNDGTKQTTDLSSPTDKDMACYVFGLGWRETNTTEVPGDQPVLESGWYIVGDGSFVNGPTWNPEGGIQMTVNEAYTGNGVEYYSTDVQFESGDIWKLCDDKNNWISSGWEEDQGGLANGDMELVSDGLGGNNVQVNKTGSYDIYFKVYDNGGFNCYISPAK